MITDPILDILFVDASSLIIELVKWRYV